MAIDLLLRGESGAPLTAPQHDQNLTDIQVAVNGNEAALGVALNADGTLKPGAFNNANQVVDSILTLAKFALTTANCIVVTSAGGAFSLRAGPAGHLVWWDAATGALDNVDPADLLLAPSRYSACATATVVQAFTLGGTEQVVNFTNEVFDIGSAYSVSTSRFTAPVQGIYRVSCALQFDNDGGSASTMDIVAYVKLNGTNIFAGTRNNTPSPTGSRWNLSFSRTVLVPAGQYLDIRIAPNASGGTGNIETSAASECHVCYELVEAT